MSWRNSFFALLLALTVAGCSSDDSKPGKTVSRPGLDFSAFDAAISQFLADQGLTGASAVVVHKDWGVVHTAGYGQFASDRIYLIASSSKILSVGILMQLADRTLVDIDAPIGNYVSAWGTGTGAPFDPPKSELKVAQLVSNSSGLVGLVDDPLYAAYICQYVDSGTLEDCAKTVYTADDAADRIPPDTEFHYGGGQWQLAGGIAEVVSGKKWAELVKDTYVDACRTPSLGFGNQFSQAFASGADGGSVGAALAYPSFFAGDPKNLRPTQNPSIEGGAYTTVEDYGRILLMHLRGGTCDGNRVLSQKAVLRMQEDRIKAYGGSTTAAQGSGGAEGYGLGWWINRSQPGVFMDPGAYGAVPWLDLPRGYGAFLALEASAGLGVQLFTTLKPLADAVFDGAKH